MNHKLFKATMAGVAALAVTAGGSTFAAWSDYDTSTNRTTGAGQLTLQLGPESTTVVNATDRLSLSPGENSVRDFWVASNHADSVPDGDLFVTPNIVSDIEDGCTNTNGERDQQLVEYGSDCDVATEGQFSDQARMTIASSDPSTSPLDCATASYPNTAVYVGTPPTPGATMLEKDGARYQVADDLAPGEGVCVRFLYLLPQSATDSVQGDSTEHNARFDLEQAV